MHRVGFLFYFDDSEDFTKRIAIKVQIISKFLFGVFNFLQKANENSQTEVS